MTSSTPIFAAADLTATLEYYRDVLGFRIDWTWGDPPNFGSVSRGGVAIMFNLHPELAKRSEGQSIWVKVDDADALFAEHGSKGAKVVEAIADRPWGVREYVVEDPNGYRLRIAGPPSSEVRPSEAFPSEVGLERRKPTAEEFGRVASLAFEGKEGSTDEAREILDRTWGGVVALNGKGEAVGVLRIVCDAPGWFSIWDVAVRPEWQGKRIGSKMMEEAMDLVAEASSGAFVYLFTFKHGFYERLGFGMETVSMRKV